MHSQEQRRRLTHSSRQVGALEAPLAVLRHASCMRSRPDSTLLMPHSPQSHVVPSYHQLSEQSRARQAVARAFRPMHAVLLKAMGKQAAAVLEHATAAGHLRSPDFRSTPPSPLCRLPCSSFSPPRFFLSLSPGGTLYHSSGSARFPTRLWGRRRCQAVHSGSNVLFEPKPLNY